MSFRAVVFDLGGVVLGSPIHAIRRYERSLGMPANAINRVVADTAPHGAWSRLERGELAMEAFYTAFESDCRAASLEISARTMFEWMAEEAQPREQMLRAITTIRSRGLRVGALTNNWATAEGAGAGPDDGTRALRKLFDVFIESSVEGLRKPDPRIYELACTQLGVAPTEAVFLDDIGANLKPARKLGLTTIKVDEPDVALAELASTLGFPLDGVPGDPGDRG
jgi:putative hydrolase of the HAD superfamily